MIASDVFVMNYAKMSNSELIPWLLDTATLQEAHPFHSVNWPEWVPGAAKLREHADSLSSAVKDAENKDREKAKKRDMIRAEVLLSISLNANYIVMRSLHEKDESLICNVGYVLKEKRKRAYGVASIKTTPLELKVKNGPEPGSLNVRFEKDPAAGSYQLQMCKGKPVGEESWSDQGIYKRCRVAVGGLELATWYYFRVRSHGDNETSPWSTPFGIIVV